MEFSEKLWIALFDKALLGGVLLISGFILKKWLEDYKHALTIDSSSYSITLQSEISFKEKQLSNFYGPIYALLKRIRPIDDLWNKGLVSEVDKQIIHIIRESNDKIVEIILRNSHLIYGSTIPDSYTNFLTHVAVWHSFWDKPDADWSQYTKLREAHYDFDFEKEIFETTEALKQEIADMHSAIK
jgi:hypothetical protein